MRIQKKTILELNYLQNLQRGKLKKNYVNFISNPVNCLKKINKQIQKNEKYKKGELNSLQKGNLQKILGQILLSLKNLNWAKNKNIILII